MLYFCIQRARQCEPGVRASSVGLPLIGLIPGPFGSPQKIPLVSGNTDWRRKPTKWLPGFDKAALFTFLQEWQPPFACDVDRLQFTPRIQRLNELEVWFVTRHLG